MDRRVDSLHLVIALFRFVILLFSLSFHECAHAWMASRLGDQTARMQGRVTLNPVVHIDPIGTLLFPALMIFGPLFGFGRGGFLVGWAKPTPVITRNFKHIRRDDNLTTLAGPFSNLILVFASFVMLAALILAVPGGREPVRLLVQYGEVLGDATAVQGLALLSYLAIEVNLALLFFNLLPIPPLDGSHVVRNMLPYNSLDTFDQIGRYGFLVIFLLGGYVVSFFMGPAIGLVDQALLILLH
jgi:Zn-dependent protease